MAGKQENQHFIEKEYVYYDEYWYNGNEGNAVLLMRRENLPYEYEVAYEECNESIQCCTSCHGRYCFRSWPGRSDRNPVQQQRSAGHGRKQRDVALDHSGLLFYRNLYFYRQDHW